MEQVKESAEHFLLEEFLPYRLSLLSNTVSEGIANAYRKEHGLSVTEWRVIAVLGRYPGLTASEIVGRTAMDKVAVSRAVKKLRQRKVLEKGRQEEDRRRLPLKLTKEQGVPLFRRIVPKALAYEKRLLSTLSASEVRGFEKVLLKLQQSAGSL